MPPQRGPLKMLQQLMQFKNTLRGDPKQQVMNLLQSGQINQNQLNDLQNQAQQIRNMMQNMHR